ncbi:MAG: hypothetical protein EZS28_010440 [Streblomastix strix]|uniref:Uncharacterized protein n=1 Tax=Streblomastix strix TaxID=222440 RepID=A0A5J4WI96_9EUKA|nr:MAG: hypothetical protein EZS28_010440 [Streblomastix strix]
MRSKSARQGRIWQKSHPTSGLSSKKGVIEAGKKFRTNLSPTRQLLGLGQGTLSCKSSVDYINDQNTVFNVCFLWSREGKLHIIQCNLKRRTQDLSRKYWKCRYKLKDKGEITIKDQK